jgi:hypothetical protein
MKNATIAVLLAACFADIPIVQARDVGMGVLMMWPTARSTALAGAMTGLADEADATYFNPAGLAFQTTAKVDLTYANWLQDLYPGMRYAFVEGGVPLSLRFLWSRKAFIAGSATCLRLGRMFILNEHTGRNVGQAYPSRGGVGVHVAAMLSDNFAVGLGTKLVRSQDAIPPWPYLGPSPFRGPEFGLETGGSCTDVAFDVGTLYRPTQKLSIGVALSNIGPDITYRPNLPAEAKNIAALPTTARLGLAWTFLENRSVRLCVMPELTKVLVGGSADTAGKSLCQRLGEEWRDVWKALGIEATAYGLVSLRLGYFEDLTSERGGFMYGDDHDIYQHLSITDIFTESHAGKLRRIGLCWGFGVGTDMLRFDLSSDAAIYNFPTENWKLQLTCNDIGGLF